MRVGAIDGVHGVVAHPETGRRKKPRDGSEVEQGFHQVGVVRHGIEHLDGRRAEAGGAEPVEIDVLGLQCTVPGDAPRRHEDGFGHPFGRRPAVGDIHLHAEIPRRPAGIMARRQQDPAGGRALADQTGDRPAPREWCESHSCGAIFTTGWIAVGMITPIAAHHERGVPGQARTVEDRLHEVLEIVRLQERRDRFAQARRSRRLVGERRRRHGSTCLTSPSLGGARRRGRNITPDQGISGCAASRTPSPTPVSAGP